MREEHTAAGGFGAVLLAILGGLGRCADDVARGFVGCADDVARPVIRCSDETLLLLDDTTRARWTSRSATGRSATAQRPSAPHRPSDLRMWHADELPQSVAEFLADRDDREAK